MGAAEDVAGQFINPGDSNTLYEGSGSPKRLIDLRSMIKYITWDLLRFQKPADRKSDSDVTTPWGMRDSLSRQHLVAEQNNFMLRKLCKAYEVDLTGMPGS